MNVSASFTDAGTHDTHTATVNWGDTTFGSATVTETNGAGTPRRDAHVRGARPVHDHRDAHRRRRRHRDADRDGRRQRPADRERGRPVHRNRGHRPANLAGTATDPEHDPLTTTWTITPTAEDPGTTCTPTGTSTLTPTITCDDDAVLNATLVGRRQRQPADRRQHDGDDQQRRARPRHRHVRPPRWSRRAARSTSSASFTDAGTHDTHTATVNWGDLPTTNATITESRGCGHAQRRRTRTRTSGLYTVTITLTDDNGGTDVRTTQVVVNTPPTVERRRPVRRPRRLADAA